MDKMMALTIFVAAAEHGSAVGDHQGCRAPGKRTGRAPVRAHHPAHGVTEAGNLYLDGARQALLHLQRVTEEVEQLQYALRGTLRITAPPSFGYLSDRLGRRVVMGIGALVMALGLFAFFSLVGMKRFAIALFAYCVLPDRPADGRDPGPDPSFPR